MRQFGEQRHLQSRSSSTPWAEQLFNSKEGPSSDGPSSTSRDCCLVWYSRTVWQVSSSLSALVFLSLFGAACGPLIAKFAARRSIAQPLPFKEQAELTLAECAELDPAWAAAHPDVAEAMAHPEHKKRFTHAAGMVQSDEPSEEGPATAVKETKHRDRAVAQVLDAAYERDVYPGACGISVHEEAPYVRRGTTRTSLVRLVCITAATAATGATAGYVADNALAAIAVLVLGLAGWVVAAVDHDTLYLDIQTWWSAAVVAGVVAIASVVADAGFVRLGWSALAGLIWWALFEGINVMYRLVRKVDGIGGGDGMIAFGAVFVTTALTGSLPLVLWSVLAGMVVSLCASVPLVLLKRRGGREAFALGPFLALGWQLALVAHVAGIIV